MKQGNFCGTENISVIIPYSELERMLQSANKIEQIEAMVRRMDQRCAAMNLLYSEILEKVREINRYL